MAKYDMREEARKLLETAEIQSIIDSMIDERYKETLRMFPNPFSGSVYEPTEEELAKNRDETKEILKAHDPLVVLSMYCPDEYTKIISKETDEWIASVRNRKG